MSFVIIAEKKQLYKWDKNRENKNIIYYYEFRSFATIAKEKNLLLGIQEFCYNS